ncbi:MAG: hypothetical protein MJ200_00255 [Mycoplasmoidaceae bacterium]|nr:hypothetical protein [Mycoplasmoidaceae bacterium]
MRTKKHLLTAAFVTAASTIATTIPCIASCAYKNGRITPIIKTINIDLPSTDFSVNEYHTTTTDPIIVECFDEHGKEVKGEIE